LKVRVFFEMKVFVVCFVCALTLFSVVKARNSVGHPIAVVPGIMGTILHATAENIPKDHIPSFCPRNHKEFPAWFNPAFDFNAKCFSFYLINYFTDSDDEYIIEHEPVVGKLNISFSNSINLANNIPEYFEKLDNYKVDVISNSVITGDYGIFKINCDKNQKVLSYINIYKKNEINDVIYFSNQKAFLFLQKDQLHSFTLDSKLLEEKHIQIIGRIISNYLKT